MSVIRKKPYIESVLENLTKTQRTNLINIMDGSGTNAYKTLAEACALSNGIHALNLQLDKDNLKSGILIKLAAKTCFIAYHRYQDVLLFDIDVSNKKYTKVNEYCDINELRRIVGVAIGIAEVSAEELAATLQGSDDIVVDLNETSSKVVVKLDQDVKEAIYLQEVDADDITLTTADSNSTITIASGIINPEKHIHLMFEVEGTGIHYGGDCILHPYDEANVCFVCGRVDVNGSIKDYTATMDEDGSVNINILGATVDSGSIIKVHYLTLLA